MREIRRSGLRGWRRIAISPHLVSITVLGLLQILGSTFVVRLGRS